MSSISEEAWVCACNLEEAKWLPKRPITWESMDMTRSPEAQQLLDTLLNTDEEAPFKQGDRVRHATFGDGMVVQVSGSGAEMLVTVAFPKRGIKKLDPQYAKLEKL